MHFIIGLIILPVVMLLGALHFIMLAVVRICKLRKAEVTTFKHLIALDVYANTLLGGDHRETISSRLGRNLDCRVCRLICRFLNIFDPDHCAKSAEAFKRLYKND